MNNQVHKVNKIKAKACIYENNHLDQHYLKRIQLLKININSWNQSKKAQKSVVASQIQSQDKTNLVKQRNEVEKVTDKKARKVKKKKAHYKS